MSLNERILLAIAGGALLGSVGCQPSPIPDRETTSDTIEKESPEPEVLEAPGPEAIAAPVDSDDVVAPKDPVKTERRRSNEDFPDFEGQRLVSSAGCADAFTEEELQEAKSGRAVSSGDLILSCANTCAELRTWSSSPNGSYQKVCESESEGKCCQVQEWEKRRYYRGRPFVVEGEVRTGRLESTGAWASLFRLDCDLPEDQRARVIEVWAEAGTEEHASIASFSQFMLDLMSLAAPPELIQETAKAISDEVLHAQACFGIASALQGSPVGPGPVNTTGLQATRTPEEMLRAALREGCVGETLAAHLAGWLATRAVNPTVQGVLSGIAEDEGRHAALAWQFSAWVLATRPELRWVAEEEFASLRHETSQLPETEADLSAWGVPSPSQEAELSARAVEELLVPAFEALLVAPVAS
jgi:hypothetical protein